MMSRSEIVALNLLVVARPTDLVLRAVDRGLLFHGEFDGYGDFFSLHLGEVEYIDAPGTFPVGGFRLATVLEASQMEDKWRFLHTDYSGQALVMWNADAPTFEEATSSQRYLVLSEELELRRGSDCVRGASQGEG